MARIGSDNSLITFFSGKRSLTSSKLHKIDIFLREQQLRIDLFFELIYTNEQVKLSFTGIREYSFYYHSDYFFYNVEIVKFFEVKGGVYISLDPTNEEENISSEDQDYVLSNNVEGFILTQ